MVTIVTPTLNAGAHIEATLRSVEGAGPVLEHLIVDGGSTDETATIVSRYPHARWLPIALRGQTAAMNHGASVARGTYLVFLNADDVLLPDALPALLDAFRQNDRLAVAYGGANHVDRAGNAIEPYPTRPFDAAALREQCYICQAAAMIRRTSFERAGGFSEHLNFAMDYDLWLRMAPSAEFAYVDRTLSEARIHEAAKSVALRSEMFAETCDVLLSRTGYVPFTWVYAMADHRLQPDNQPLARRRRSGLKVLYALLLGVWINRRQPLRSIRDWLAHRSLAAR